MLELNVNALDPFDFLLWDKILCEAVKPKAAMTCNWEPFLNRFKDILYNSSWGTDSKIYSIKTLAQIIEAYYGDRIILKDIAALYGGSLTAIDNAATRSMRRFIEFIRFTELPYSCNYYKVYSTEPRDDVKNNDRPLITAKFYADNIYAASKIKAVEIVHQYCPRTKDLTLNVVLLKKFVEDPDDHGDDNSESGSITFVAR